MVLAGLLLLAGCDKIPGLGPDPRVAQRDAEAKAIGGACRHALRGPVSYTHLTLPTTPYV